MKKELAESANYEDEKSKQSRALSERQNKISQIDQDLKEAQRQLEEEKTQRSQLEEEKTKTRIEFCMLAGKLLNGQVS